MLDPEIQPTDKDVSKYISGFDQTRRQLDAQLLQQLMTRVSGEDAVIWGDDVLGFGSYRCVHKTGREWDWPVISFVLEPGRMAVYIMPGFDNYESTLKQLGKHKVSANCLYINKLADIDMRMLEKLVGQAFKDMQKSHKCM